MVRRFRARHSPNTPIGLQKRLRWNRRVRTMGSDAGCAGDRPFRNGYAPLLLSLASFTSPMLPSRFHFVPFFPRLFHQREQTETNNPHRPSTLATSHHNNPSNLATAARALNRRPVPRTDHKLNILHSNAPRLVYHRSHPVRLLLPNAPLRAHGAPIVAAL